MEFLRSVMFLAMLPAVLFTVGASQGSPTKPVIFDIPRLDNITIDGNGDDWGTRGFRVDNLHDLNQGNSDSPRTGMSDATLRFGWDDRGLLILINVVDVSPIEADTEDVLWQKDSVELYMTDKVGGKEYYQVVVAPGVDGKHPDIRIRYYDSRSSSTLKAKPLNCIVARTKTATGYVMEALMPWSNLGIVPGPGVTVGTQVMVNDYDAQGALWHKLWYPQAGAAASSEREYTVRLAEKPSPPVVLQTYCYQERFRHVVVSTIGATDQTGNTLIVREGGRQIGSAKFRRTDDGRSVAEVLLPLAPAGSPYGALTASVDGGRYDLDPSPIYFERAKAILRLQVAFSSYVFGETAFPNDDFADPALAENLLGRYTLRTTYYDSKHHVVTSADTPGRYGAFVDVTTEYGIKLHRYITLYRLPVPTDMKSDADADRSARETRDAAIVQSILQEANVTEPSIAEQTATLARMFRGIKGNFYRQPESAVALAGLAETAPGSAEISNYTSPQSRDSRWWYVLQQQLGISEAYPYVILYPDGYGKDATKRYPLVVFLHGAGASDTDYAAFQQDPVDKGLVGFAKTQYPSIVVAPFSQLGGWSPERVDAVVADVIAKAPVDRSRIYLTGLSMGGFGTWATAAAYPNKYAAAVPIAGGGDTKDATLLKNIPIWAFHGEDDNVVNVSHTRDMVKAVTDAGGHPKLTLYPGVGHWSWVIAYADPALYTWMFQQQLVQKP